VVARSRELEEEEQEDQEREEEEEVAPVAGDLLRHPKCGRGTVRRNAEDEVLVVRRPGGGTAPLARSHMKLLRTGTTEEGNAIYRLSVIRPV